ncbi:MAG: imidazole glycerol phosphate synthase subunit HisF [Nitrososphaerota archaeon]|nr:imidazole glycerol phosphate synthase subunit HisF [Candidatus Calditenuaceae archaeon]MDW8073270.1 imidazole glycerol phosphate synthase subunit HisF [Nitrososphaerota archaeon]
MLAKRIIPCLDVHHGVVVKGVSFKQLQTAGDPVDLAARYVDEGADELALLDISASVEGRETFIDVVKRVASEINVPFTVGGGVRGAEDAYRILANGADKVAVNTAAIQNTSIVTKISERFGAQCTVLAIDAKRESGPHGPWYQVYSHSATRPTGLDAVKWAVKGEELGAGEILLTSIDQDGRRTGYDVDLLRRISSAVSIPVIASGGAGELRHFLEAIKEGGADAVLAASVFHYKIFTIGQVKEYLKSHGVEVRL